MFWRRALLPVGVALLLSLAGCPRVSTLRTPAPQAGSCAGKWTDHPVAPGAVWRSIQYPDCFGGPQTVNVLQLDPAQVSLRPVQSTQVAGCTVRSCKDSPTGCYETVSSMGARAGALAGINGGFFCDGQDDICSQGFGPFFPGCSGYLAFSLLQVDGGTVSTGGGRR